MEKKVTYNTLLADIGAIIKELKTESMKLDDIHEEGEGGEKREGDSKGDR